jgi:hypothetical protein
VRAVKTLPPGYEQGGTFDVAGNKWLMIVVNAIGLVLMGFLIWLALWFMDLVFPGVDVILALWNVAGGATGFGGRAIIIVVALAITLGVGIVHELVHGLFFWALTRERPAFGAQSLYFYTGAPDWYLSRSQHVLVGLSPLVLVTVVGLVAAVFSSPAVSAWVLLAVVANAGGAAGDLVAAVWSLRQPPETFVRDTGLVLTVYRPGRGSGEAEQETG